MGDITLSQIGTWLTLVVGFITSATFIINKVKDLVQNALKPTNDKIDQLEQKLEAKIDKVSMQTSKNFIVRSMADLRNDVAMDQVTKERLFEEYERYISLGGNSYIKHEMESLKEAGKL